MSKVGRVTLLRAFPPLFISLSPAWILQPLAAQRWYPGSRFLTPSSSARQATAVNVMVFLDEPPTH